MQSCIFLSFGAKRSNYLYRFAPKRKNVTDLIRKIYVFIKEIGIIMFLNSGTQNLCGTSGDVHLGGALDQ